MKIIAPGAMLLLVALTSACSSIIDGTTQEIAVNTSPSEANCRLVREGATIGQVKTPGTVVVAKTKHDITIFCDKEGYDTATHINRSGVAGATLGNIILGGVVGWGIDSATGADNKYDSPVNITLPTKSVQPSAAPPATSQKPWVDGAAVDAAS